MKKIILILFPLLVLILASVIFIYLPVTNNITCHSQFGECEDGLYEKLSKLTGQNSRATAKDLDATLTGEASIAGFTFERNLFGDFEVHVVEKKAVSAIRDSSGDVYTYDSNNGSLLKVTSTNLPILNTNKPHGETFNESALDLTRQLYLSFKIRETYLENDYLVTHLSSQEKLFLPLDKDVSYTLGSLEIILSQLNRNEGGLRIEANEVFYPSEIDLRFENPVLR